MESIPEHLRDHITLHVRRAYMDEIQNLMQEDHSTAMGIFHQQVEESSMWHRLMSQNGRARDMQQNQQPGTLPRRMIFSSFVLDASSSSLQGVEENIRYLSSSTAPSALPSPLETRESSGDGDMALGMDNELTSSIMHAWNALMTMRTASDGTNEMSGDRSPRTGMRFSVPLPTPPLANEVHSEYYHRQALNITTPSRLPRPATPEQNSGVHEVIRPGSDASTFLRDCETVRLIVYVYWRGGPSIETSSRGGQSTPVETWHIKGFEYELERVMRGEDGPQQAEAVFNLNEDQV